MLKYASMISLMREQGAAVVAVRNAEVDADLGAAQVHRRATRIFQSLPADLQHQALLRIHAGGFTRRNAEEFRVELVDVGEERPVSRGHRARLIGVPGVKRVDRPTLWRDFGDGVSRRPQEIGEAGRVMDVAGKPHAHADDRDRAALRGFGDRQSRPKAADLGQGLFDGACGRAARRGVGQGVRPPRPSASSASSRRSASSSESSARLSSPGADVAADESAIASKSSLQAR